MSLVATIISHPAKRALTPAVATMAMEALDASAIDWLGENLACDIACPQSPQLRVCIDQN